MHLSKHKKPSVSQIVAEMFPTDPTFFQMALSAESIQKKKQDWVIKPGSIADQVTHLQSNDVMFMLNTFGTIIHSVAFDRGLLGISYPQKPNILANHIRWIEEFFIKTGARLIIWETCVETEDYTGTLDWVLEWNGKYYIIDWKTWTAYKYIYGFENSILKKNWEPYSRTPDIKKVGFQLSLYREPLEKRIKIDGMLVLWVTEHWVFYWECEYNLELFYEWKRRHNWLSL